MSVAQSYTEKFRKGFQSSFHVREEQQRDQKHNTGEWITNLEKSRQSGTPAPADPAVAKFKTVSVNSGQELL